MPIYEYECCSCNGSFEVIALSDAEASPKCPECGNVKVKKLMSYVVTRPNGIPKGSGGFNPGSCNPSSSSG